MFLVTLSDCVVSCHALYATHIGDNLRHTTILEFSSIKEIHCQVSIWYQAFEDIQTTLSTRRFFSFKKIAFEKKAFQPLLNLKYIDIKRQTVTQTFTPNGISTRYKFVAGFCACLKYCFLGDEINHSDFWGAQECGFCFCQILILVTTQE